MHPTERVAEPRPPSTRCRSLSISSRINSILLRRSRDTRGPESRRLPPRAAFVALGLARREAPRETNATGHAVGATQTEG
jgi:hypothetical protein